MTPRGERSSAEEEAVPSRPLEDLVLVLIAFLVLVVPSWLRSNQGGKAILEEKAVRPVRIDVNRAAWYEWMLLEGIGDARAKSIVEFREANGPFRSLDDLKRVPHMPPGWVDRARRHLELAADEGSSPSPERTNGEQSGRARETK